MITFRIILMLAVVAGLLVVVGCGQPAPTAPGVDTAAVTPAATAVPAADAVVLEQGEEADLQKIEAAAPAYQPVTRSNYQAELAKMESEVAAEN